MSSARAFVSRLRAVRQAKGLNQADLARHTGLTRQAIGAIEGGQYLPNTVVALRLARLLDCAVEDLFAEKTGSTTHALTLASAGATDVPDDRSAVERHGAKKGTRVAVARIRDRLIGYPLVGSRALCDGFAAADGVLGGRAGVRLLVPDHRLDRTALLLGCDPAFGLLAAHVAARGEAQVHGIFASSQRALDALAAGEAHIAGSHLHDAVSDECNVAQATAALGADGGLVVAFATWEQGLMVAPGNPRRLRAIADLVQPGVRLVNREVGAGSRHLLDELLAKAGVSPGAIRGYADCAASHLDAARRVQVGQADAAIGLRAVAETCALDFVALAEVRCDLVIPRDLIAHPGVAMVLETLQSRALRSELAALPGYGSTITGAVIADLPPRAA